MDSLTRRDFLIYGSAVTLEGLSRRALADTLERTAEKPPVPSLSPNDVAGWQQCGRLMLEKKAESITLQDGYLLSRQSWTDIDFSFHARAPEGTEEVQIWAGLRSRDRDSRYVFGMRGGNNDDLYLARYAPEGGDRFLGVAPLGFHPKPGVWYTLRALIHKNRIHIYVNDESIPRLNVEDTEPLWTEGGVTLGGGWLPVEFRNIRAGNLSETDIQRFNQLGSAINRPAEADRARNRLQQRASYKPKRIAFGEKPRTEHSLDGSWLFLPAQEIPFHQTEFYTENFDDNAWHVMNVPEFWTPSVTWLHGEAGFPQLEGVSSMKGISDKLYGIELARLDAYTFAWKETKSAWYRQYLELPTNIAGKNFELCFDAIAKISEVWVNGKHVGSHVGMFGELRLDITRQMKTGRNVIAVFVQGSLEKHDVSREVVGVAVTVEVTNAMLHSLPHGMYPETASGIWQPVTLTITQSMAVQEVFIQPQLDGLQFEVQLRNTSKNARSVSVQYSIYSLSDNSLLYSSPRSSPQSIGAEGVHLRYSTPTLTPQPWSPHKPHLYNLEITLMTDGEVVDRHLTRFGFRTFAVEGNKLLLNGNPFWLRGANHFPHALRPNDRELATRFIRLAREGNVTVTRSHTAPFSKTWLDAADEGGMAVSYEGTWPWLMLEGEPPQDELLQAWRTEFASLLRQNRNHPCIIFWTVNNEMKFEYMDRKQPELLKRKWNVLDDMIKTMRSLDATRPIVCDSSYYRKQLASEYTDFIRPTHLDDGDIDDAHRYYGWYDPSFFHFMDGQYGKEVSWPNRPAISQEMATGYPRNDDGHPVRFYLYKHFTPQTLVGPEAYEHRDPAIFLTRQAFMTKELAETLRRTTRDTCAGTLHFAYVSWFKDVWDARGVRPFPTYDALKKALAPVLVSAELYSRHFYAGETAHTRVCIANDAEDGSTLPECTLTWELIANGVAFAQGHVSVPAVAYYTNGWVDVEIKIPATLPSPRVNGSLLLRLQRDTAMIAANDYDVTLATRAWAACNWSDLVRKPALLDPFQQAPATLRYGGACISVASLEAIAGQQTLIIAAADRVLSHPGSSESLHRFVTAGGRALLLNPRSQLGALYPSQVGAYREVEGENVWMKIPEARVFSGIEPLDLCWFQQATKSVPRACSGVHHVSHDREDAIALAEVIDRHGYLKKPEDVVHISGSPLISLRVGAGLLIASEMMLEAEEHDPIAGRLLANLVRYLDDAEVFSQPQHLTSLS